MKILTLATPTPLAVTLGHRRVAFALAVIVTLLAGLAAPRAFAQVSPDPDQAAPAENTTELPGVSRLVYLSQLPTAASLQKEAVASGSTIVRLDRTDDSVVVIYQHADGRTENVGYTILSPDSAQEEPAVVATPSRPAPEITVVSAPPPPTIIYRERAPVYYESYESRYYDRVDNFWAPLALGLGIGYISQGHGGYNRGYSGYNRGYSRDFGRGNSFHRGGYRSGGRRR